MNIFDIYNKHFKVAFWLIIIVEILSFWAHLYGAVNAALFFLIIALTFAVSLWKLEYGFWIACAELFIGSFGYLFFYDAGDFRVSVRLGIFLAVFLAWLIRAVKEKRVTFFHSTLFWPLAIFLAALIGGALIGVLRGNSLKNVFFDVNAYLYFGLIFVAFAVIISPRRISELLQIFFASVCAVAIKTFFLLFYFSHQTNEHLLRLVYTWVRDTRVGEIALVVQRYYRIFFQSHVWELFAFFLVFILLVLTSRREWAGKNYRAVWVVAVASSATLIVSFSRSFWLALGVCLVIIFIYFRQKERVRWGKITMVIVCLALVALLELGMITLLVNVKLPGQQGGGISATSLVSERLTAAEEAAIGSRFSLLKPLVSKFLEKPILGSGFGTMVSYQTLDPRTKEKNGGWYTSYAFEWGYLDILVKIGLVGLLVYFFFIWKIVEQGITLIGKTVEKRDEYLLTIGLLFCLFGLLVIHFTTPYLNHPLGILLLIIIAATFNALEKAEKHPADLNKSQLFGTMGATKIKRP